jgi:hypothetical protein
MKAELCQYTRVRGLIERGIKPLTVLASAATLGGAGEVLASSLAVSPARMQRLGDSIVMLLDRPKDSDVEYHPDCSGVKVELDGDANYVLTAAHCAQVHITEKRKPAKAVNLLPDDPDEYIIAGDTSIGPSGAKSAKLFGNVSAAAEIADVHKPGPDMLLLKITNTNPVAAERFKHIPAIPYNDIGNMPEKGEDVVVESFPSSVNFSLVQTEGKYLGRINKPRYLNWLGWNNSVDIVGLNVPNAVNDACEHGGSGASFISPSTISGPVSFRSEAGDELNRPSQGDTPQQLAQGKVLSEASRKNIKAALHVNLSKFNVVCVFTVPPRGKEEKALLSVLG